MPADPRSLTPGDTAILDRLKADLQDQGPGVSRAELEVIGGVRGLNATFRRFEENGYTRPGETPDGKLQLGHDAERTASNSPDLPASTTHTGCGGAAARISGERKTPEVLGDAGLITRASTGRSLDAEPLFRLDAAA